MNSSRAAGFDAVRPGGPEWTCLCANDFDHKKGRISRETGRVLNRPMSACPLVTSPAQPNGGKGGNQRIPHIHE